MRMRRNRALKRGRWISLLVAGFVGYLLGDWHAIALRSVELSASQNVALRFPEAKAETAVADTAADMPAGAASSMVLGNTQLALLSPDPMVQPARQSVAQTAPQARVQVALLEEAAPLPPAETVPSRKVMPAAAQPKAEARPMAAVQPKSELKSAAIADAARHANRPGFVLNDTQIASIRSRLHLSPDQQQMWPAVEAALRSIAYAKARDARRHGAPGSSDVAALDPDSAEVQGLKSAAFPLIMSFSDEQRNEVRSLAHVMGLDQLASQF
jgi:hypothetical protein